MPHLPTDRFGAPRPAASPRRASWRVRLVAAWHGALRGLTRVFDAGATIRDPHVDAILAASDADAIAADAAALERDWEAIARDGGGVSGDAVHGTPRTPRAAPRGTRRSSRKSRRV